MIKKTYILIMLLVLLYILFPTRVSSVAGLLLYPIDVLSFKAKSISGARVQQDTVIITEGDVGFKSTYVLKNPPQTVYDSIVIKNQFDLKKYDNIFSLDNEWIGIVESVNTNGALVILASSNGYQTNVSINNQSAFAVGTGGGVLVATVPKTFDISPGDEVITKNWDTKLGKVLEIKEESEFENNIYIEFTININTVAKIIYEQ